MKKENMEIRELLERKRLRQWEVAYQVGISAERFCKWLRTPLSEENKNRILEAVVKLTEQIDERGIN